MMRFRPITTLLIGMALLLTGCVLAGCMQTNAEFEGVKFSTTRMLYDTGLESAKVEVDPATKVIKLDIQGYQSEGSRAIELAKAAMTLAAQQRDRESETAADEAGSPPSLFEDPNGDSEPDREEPPPDEPDPADDEDDDPDPEPVPRE